MDAIENWHDFNVAMVGATAALAGLVIVAASVNIADIVKATSLTARLATAIASLVLALTASAIGLVPELAPVSYGITVFVVSLAFMIFPVSAGRRIYQNRAPENQARAVKAVLGFIPPLAYLAGSVMLVAGSTGGVVVFAAGSIIAIMAALLISWVVLVEVLR